MGKLGLKKLRDNKSELTGLLDKCIGFCFLISIVLLPFNGLTRLPYIAGEFSVEGAFYPLAVALLLAGARFIISLKIQFPKTISFYLLFVFILAALVSGLFNIKTIMSSQFAGRTGIDKFVLQFLVLVFTFSVCMIGYDVVQRNWKDRFIIYAQNAVLISFVIVGCYSLLELFYLFGNEWAQEVIIKLNMIFRSNDQLLCHGRIRSVSREASFFGNYLSFAYPFLLMFLFNKNRAIYLRLIMTSFIFILCYFTFSRTVYAIITVQTILIFLLIFMKKNVGLDKRRLSYFAIATIITIIILFRISPTASYVLKSFDKKNINNPFMSSNIGRTGSLVAAVKIGYDNPVLGVGLGQFGFFMGEYIPKWALVSEEVRSWINPNLLSQWPITFNLHARIFAEMGSLGIILWLLIWIYIMLKLIKKYFNNRQKENSNNEVYVIAAVVGVLLSGMTIDTFRFMGYWYVMIIYWLEINKESLDPREFGSGPKSWQALSC